MAAHPSREERAAFAMPRPGLEIDRIGVVVALESSSEAGDANPVFFFGVSPGFVDLTDDAGVHAHLPLAP